MFVTAVVALVVAQGQIAVFGLDDGLAAAGWITLAATLTRYADRADQILATTIYPAIVRVRDRVDVLEELFEKANRLTLMWAFPFGAGLALFGADLIVFVLGDEWRGAIVLLGGLAVAVALQQVGYSWFAFYRARGESWPQAVESAVFGAAFARAGDPGRAARRLVGVRGRAARLHGVPARGAQRLRPPAAAGRAAVRDRGAGRGAGARWRRRPCWPCGSRCGAGSGRSAQALGELALWLAGLALATRRLEGGLLAELRGYLRRRPA